MFEQPAYAWADPEWRASAEAWIGRVMGERGGELAGPTCGVRFMPWSAVLRAPTSEGDVYFKACGPSQAHEPALAALLYEARPDCVVRVLSTDTRRRWLLTADGGPTLTEILHPGGDSGSDGSAHWSRVLALIAGVQREMMPRAGELLAIGVPDRRPAALAAYFADLTSRPEVFLIDEPDALSAVQLDHLRSLVPRVVDWAAELAALGPPDTYFHDDFHEDHIFAHRQDDDWRYAFFDFGDAAIGHPFLQLVSHPRFATPRFMMRGDPTIEGLQEIYLNTWLDYGDQASRQRALDMALILGCIARALTWVNACEGQLDTLPSPLRQAYASRLAFWMMQISARGEMVDGI